MAETVNFCRNKTLRKGRTIFSSALVTLRHQIQIADPFKEFAKSLFEKKKELSFCKCNFLTKKPILRA